ncbi:MAG TPA: hypothetical protein VJ453_12285 [Terriglobales bacterium]|jgi:hypothetical protein|nr:hypothetical protein [Terriglobales bacterium]
MIADFANLVLGLVVALFHRPIANFILDRERALDSFFRRHGVTFPEPPTQATAHNIYFCLGLFISVFSMARIWLSL